MRWTPSRFRLIGAAIAFAAVAAAFAATPWQVTSLALRQETARRIALALGAPVATFDKISITLLPAPHVTLTGLTFRQTSGLLAGEAPIATLSLKLAPLLRGVLKPGGVTLARPALTAQLPAEDDAPFRQARLALAHISDILAVSGRLNGLTALAIDDGAITLTGAGGALDRIDAVRMRAALAGPDDPLKLSFTGRRAGEDLRVTFAGASPEALRTGATEPLALTYWTPGWNAEFIGTGSLSGEMTVKGSFTAGSSVRSTLAPPQVLALLGLDKLPPVTVRATVDAGGRGATFTDLTIGLDLHRITGVGALRHDGQRWRVSGTLATERADFSGMLAQVRGLRRADGGWSTARIAQEALFSADIDLRLSADQAALGSATLQRAAFALITRANRMEATLGEAGVFKGAAKARLTATPGADALDVKLTASLDNADVGAALLALGAPRRFTGLGSASVALETSGQSFAEFVANLGGRAQAALRNGELTGIDLNRLAQRRGGRPDGWAEALTGATPFETATLSARIVNGAASPVEGRLQAGRLIGEIRGAVDFAQGVNALSGTVVQILLDAAQTEPQPVMDFTITGPLSEPSVTPNLAALLKRS